MVSRVLVCSFFFDSLLAGHLTVSVRWSQFNMSILKKMTLICRLEGLPQSVECYDGRAGDPSLISMDGPILRVLK